MTTAGHQFKRNRAGNFAEPVAIPGAAALDLNNSRLMDLFGDARPELVTNSSSGWVVYRLTNGQWKPVSTSFPGSVNLPLIDSTAAHLDLNGDGRTDVISSTAVGLVFNKNGANGLVPIPMPPIAGDATLVPGRSGLRFADVNGDGLDDAVLLQDQALTFYLGHGDGTFDAGQRVAYPWSDVTPIDLVHLADLNRDGLIDLVRITGGNVEMYAGQPGGTFVATPRTIARPESVDSAVTVTIADVNGNGSQDVVWSSSRGMWALDLAGATSAGMLVGIDNGLGKVTQFKYDASGPLEIKDEDAGKPWIRTLPLSIPVPVQTAISPGAGEPTELTQYAVRDGFWDYDERRFGGFQTVSKIVPGVNGGDPHIEVTTYHLGLASLRELRGEPLSVRVYAGTTLVRATSNTYVAGAIDGLPDDKLLRKPERMETRVLEYEGLPAGQSLATVTDYTFDGQGNVIAEARQGRTDLTGDELTITRTYASNDALWVRNVLVSEEHRKPDGSVVSAKQYFYGDENTTLPLGQVGKGWQREVQAWVAYNSESARWVTQSQSSYDAVGNVTSSLEAGVQRAIQYDQNGLHPVRETAGDATTHLTWLLRWDNVLGKPLELTDPSGNRAQVSYDALGRPTAVAYNGAAPHLIYNYNWVAPRPTTTTFTFDGAPAQLGPFGGWQPASGWRQEATVSDGAGNPLFKATRLDTSRWIIEGWRTRDERGRVVTMTAPFYYDGSDLPIAPDATAAVQRLSYDALDRLIDQDTPTGGHKRTSYAAYTQVESVSDLAPITRRFDGAGRIFHSERNIGGTLEGVDAQYDVDDRITALTLQGNVTHAFSYDSLGRLRHGSDPDIGARDQIFDDGNHVIGRSNGAGQTVAFAWDALGRVVRTQSGTDAPYIYHYDQPKAGSASSNTAARLAWVEEPSGEVVFSYDSAGHQTLIHRVIEGNVAEQTSNVSLSGLVLGLAFDDGLAVPFAYDAAGREIAAGDYWRAGNLDAAGRVLDERYGNGALQHYEVDASGQITRVQVQPSSGAAALYDVRLTRTPGGFISAIIDQDGVGLDHSATLGYDGAGRLTDALLGSGASQYHFQYGYDGLQNMVSRLATGPRDLGILVGNYRYGENGAGPRQLTSVQSPTGALASFSYDGAGRQVSAGAEVMRYSGLDQLIGVDRQGASVARYSYGYDNLRTASHDGAGNVQYWFTDNLVVRNGVREHYVHVGDRVVARVVAATASAAGGKLMWAPLLLLGLLLVPGRRRLRGVMATLTLTAFTQTACHAPLASSRASVTTTPVVTYFHTGVSAGPALFTTQTGTLAEERRFEPFGQPIDADGAQAVAGSVNLGWEPTNSLNKETDVGTGLSYHGERWMQPTTARWLTPDPPVKAPDPKFMQAPWKLHPYQYVNQNPIAFWDPDGRDAVDRVVAVAKSYPALAPVARALTQMRADAKTDTTVRVPGMSAAEGNAALVDATANAVIMLAKASRSLQRWDASDQAASRTWFGDATEETRQMMIQRVNREIVAISHMKLSNFHADPPDMHSRYAAIDRYDRTFQIQIGNLFKGAPVVGTDSRAGTLVHELSHSEIIGATTDHGKTYGEENAKNLANTDPEAAKSNADNFEYFVEHSP
jgi:RHS repeat-associated protein